MKHTRLLLHDRLNIEVTLFVDSDGKKKASITGKVTREEQFVYLEDKAT
jgi:hypothetical protein